MEKGIFCLSIDTEFLWGRIGYVQPFLQDTKKVRSVIKKLLSLLTKYDIPATWAVVGELLNPGEPLWHAPKMIKTIQKTKNQEIGCHSFSHLVLDEKECSPKAVEEEIKNCLRAAKKEGIKLNSFVFPYNLVGHLKLLKKYGFSCFRGPEPYWFSKTPQFQKVFQILDFLLLFTPPVSKPIKHSSGLINIPGSMYYVSARGLRKFLPVRFRVIKAKKGLDQAVKKGEIFHLWFHALDLARKTEKMLWGLEKIFQYAVKLRNEEKLETKSMVQIAEEYSKS